MLLFAVPADDVDVAVMGVVDRYFTRGARWTPHVPDTQRFIHGTRTEYLTQQSNNTLYFSIITSL